MRTLAQVVAEVQALQSTKSKYTLGQLQDLLEELSQDLQNLADQLRL